MLRITLVIPLLLLLTGCVAPGSAEESRPGVTWAEWSPEAFARAAREERPILINVVAGWCHWCHVMDERTYHDPQVVQLIEERFVAIRVDSDARPDLAERYQRWGWPATAVLTPDAEPVLERRGFQGPDPFRGLLEQVLSDQEAGKLTRRPPVAPPECAADLQEVRRRVRAQLDGVYDVEAEGWGQMKQRYPWPAPAEHAFLRNHLRAGEGLWAERALRTLAAEANLIDPVWGGMYQYSDDGSWTSPHYEKIVPVQAGALANFAQAYRETGDELWLERCHSIYRYLREFLQAPSGVFRASQDAEPPHSALNAGLSGDSYFALEDAQRRSYGLPRVDQAVYAELNGLLVSALCDYYQASGDHDVLSQATQAMEALWASHRLRPGVYTHVEGKADRLLYLADHVALGRACLALSEVSGQGRWLEEALAIAEFLCSKLADFEGGGFLAHTVDPAAVGAFSRRRRPFRGNAEAARFLLRLGLITGDERYRDAAGRALRSQADPQLVASWGRMIGEYLLALEEYLDPPLVVRLVATPAQVGSTTEALYQAALASYSPGLAVVWSPPSPDYPGIDRPALFVCGDGFCSTPLTEPEEVSAQVQAFVRELWRCGGEMKRP